MSAVLTEAAGVLGGGILKEINAAIDHFTLSADAKAAIQTAAVNAQIAQATKEMDYRMQILEAQTKVITAEASSGSWLTQNWRPITMMVFLVLVVLSWFRGPPPNMPPDIVMVLFETIKLGLGGYVIGRSAEKIATPVVQAIAAAVKK
jgi:hypothetical protein